MTRMRGHEALLDTRQLHLLSVLLSERSVSRTAAILGQSAPAVSASLKRLREVLGDPILVRSGVRLVPTERAQAIVAPVRMALASIEQIMAPDELFEPAACSREFHIATADCMGSLLLPRLLRLVREEARQARLLTRAVEPEFDYPKALEEGELDIAVGCWERPPLSMRASLLVEDDLVCLVHRDHELARRKLPGGRLSLAEFVELEHLVRTLNQLTCPGLIHDCLAENAVERRIVATVPEFMLAPPLLIESDLVFTTGRLFAEYWAGLLPLAIIEAPIELRAIRTLLLWHDRTHRSPCGRWLRDLTRRAAAELVGHKGRHAPAPAVLALA